MPIQKPPYVGKKGTIEHPAWYAGQKGWGNRKEPDVYVLSATQDYPIGTKFVDGERTFTYGYIHTNENNASASKGCLALCNLSEAKALTHDAVIEPIGETEIKIEDTTCTVNQYAGGYYLPRVNPYTSYRVLSNTVSDGTHAIITLERGLITATSASLASSYLNEHPYKKLCATWSTGRQYVSWMGVCLVDAIASRYGWVQTWGPCYMSGGDERPGSENYLREAQIHIDGTLVQYGWDTTTAQQRAGYVINSTGTGTTSSWFIYLMINR